MLELLRNLYKNGTKVAFLFPSTPAPTVGIVEDVQEDKVTVLVERNGEKYRFVTHPNSIVLTETVASRENRV